jgi:hypothetical protein
LKIGDFLKQSNILKRLRVFNLCLPKNRATPCLFGNCGKANEKFIIDKIFREKLIIYCLNFTHLLFKKKDRKEIHFSSLRAKRSNPAKNNILDCFRLRLRNDEPVFYA